MPGIHTLVGLPFGKPEENRTVMPEWALALRNLQVPMNCTYAFAPTRGLPIDEARNQLAELALVNSARFLMMIDDDTAPPQNALHRLIAAMEFSPDTRVTGGIYFSREKSPQPIVFKEEGGGNYWGWTYGDVFECSSLGTGCILVDTRIFKELEKPWFRTIPEETLTDDIYFCRKVRAAGFKIVADGGVIPLHWDAKTGKSYVMSQDDPPVRRFKENMENLQLDRTPEFTVKTPVRPVVAAPKKIKKSSKKV